MIPTWVVMAVIAAIIGVTLAGAILSYYFSRVAKTAATTRPAMTTDEVLASLSTNITVLGGIIAVATIVIGLAALYGYAELRTATVRKTEEDLHSIIEALARSGDLTEATATVLRGAVKFSGENKASQVGVQSGTTTKSRSGEIGIVAASNVVQNDNQLADDYPESDQS